MKDMKKYECSLVSLNSQVIREWYDIFVKSELHTSCELEKVNK